jgi:prepilin-type N-terminal cleavage/methylation domain-containing protein
MGAEDAEVDEMRSRREMAFTLVEMLVVLAIIAVLVALVLGVIQLARPYAYRATCMSNLRQLVMALKMYDQTWGGPPGTTEARNNWDKVQPEIKPVLLCPADFTKGELLWGSLTPKPKHILRSSYTPFYWWTEVGMCSGRWAPLPDSERIWFWCDWCTDWPKTWRQLVAYADGHVALSGVELFDIDNPSSYPNRLKRACLGGRPD